VAQKFHFAILRIEVTRASRGLSAIAELLVQTIAQKPLNRYNSAIVRRINIKFFTMTHFDPLKPSNGQKFDLKNQDGRQPVRCGWVNMLAQPTEYD